MFRQIAPLAALIIAAGTLPVSAIPNTVFGGIVQAVSPLDDQDVTPQIIAAATWSGEDELPGNWKPEGQIATARLSYLLARPKLFGQSVVLLRAIHRDDRLELLEATFADAGTYFGYYDTPVPKDLSRRERQEFIATRMAGRQAEFSTMFHQTLTSLQGTLAELSEDSEPDESRLGRSRHLRTEAADYRCGDLVLRLLHADQRLIRVQITRAKELPQNWLDRSLDDLSERDRLARLSKTVERRDDGTVLISTLRPIPQGYQPYCGLNTLAMAARHFGLHVDEDWLAAAAGFKNTGSAAGSNLPRIYRAVATEAGLSLEQSNRFDPSAARRAIAEGLPVVVWRRFSAERNDLHSRFARRPSATLPDPANPQERASWPDSDAPLHASVLVGYNDERREFHFLESWSGRDIPRRMRTEELEATAYLSFVFER